MEADPPLTTTETEAEIEISGCGSSGKCYRCERLKKGELFKSYEDFQNVLEHYKIINNVVFVTYNATTVEYFNRKIAKSAEAQCPTEWKYRSASFNCKHHGKLKTTSTSTRGKGIKECR